jgi:outer membrane protein OmpA-like peptidoglycan-associated protein
MVLIMEIKKVVLLIYILLISNCVFGQRNVLRYADSEFELKRFANAGAQYSKAYENKKSYYAAKRAAESYSFIKSYEKSYEWWFKVVSFPEAERNDQIEFARATILSGRKLQNIGITLSEKDLVQLYGKSNVPMNKEIDFQSLDFYNDLGSDYGLNSFKPGINYFVSDRIIDVKKGKKSMQSDANKRPSSKGLYLMNDRGYHNIFKDSGNGNISPVKVDLEDVYHLSMPSFFKQNIKKENSKQEVVFTAVLSQKRVKQNKIDLYPGLYRAEVSEDGNFKNVVALPFNKHLEYSVMHGVVYGNKLYFSSDMPGGFGGFDLYYAVLKSDGYGPALNLGPEINSAANEVFPYLYDDDLYFSSDRIDGLGGLDIFSVSISQNEGVKNMGIPYNSSQDDFAFFVDGNGKQYISSDRGNGESRDDIYSLINLENRYKLRVITESGTVIYSNEDIEIEVNTDSGKKLLAKLNGTQIEGIVEDAHSLVIKRKGFFPAQFKLDKDPKNFNITYKLIPIPFKQKLAIDTIYYDLDKYNILPDAAESLILAEKILRLYPDFGLNITSHTDSRASSSYNERLSKRRSLSASNFLKNRGILNKRLSLDWKGKEELANPCTEGVNCPELLHKQNRRSILSLELYPDENKVYNLPAGLEKINTSEELMNYLKKMLRSTLDSLKGIDVDGKYELMPSDSREKFGEKTVVKPITKLVDKPIEKVNSPIYSDNLASSQFEIVSPSAQGSYFLIIESWGSEYNALKRAKELSGDNNSRIYIVPPYNDENKNYRIAVGKYDSLQKATNEKEIMRIKYQNQNVWVFEYK